MLKFSRGALLAVIPLLLAGCSSADAVDGAAPVETTTSSTASPTLEQVSSAEAAAAVDLCVDAVLADMALAGHDAASAAELFAHDYDAAAAVVERAGGADVAVTFEPRPDIDLYEPLHCRADVAQGTAVGAWRV